MRPIGFGNDDNSAGFAVQAMDYSGTRRTTDGTEFVEMESQCRSQGARPVTLGGMHNHARRFVDADNIVIFINDVQWNVLGHRSVIFRLRIL